MRRGFDIDGVLIKPKAKGVPRPGLTDFIITGRSSHYAFKTIMELSEHMIYTPVYFNPLPTPEVNPQTGARWKAAMIAVLGIEQFWEDDPYQVTYLREHCPSVEIIHVV